MRSIFDRRILVRALLCCALALIPFSNLENAIYDFKVRVGGPKRLQRAQEVVIVELNKDDFEELKKNFDSGSPQYSVRDTWYEKFASLRDQFFWNDAVILSSLEKLIAQDPNAILVNFYYPESVTHLQNQSQLQHVVRTPKVLWASQFDMDQKFLKPSAELTGAENYGFINMQADTDGVVRHAVLIQSNHASLPFRALMTGAESLQSQLPITEPFLINFAGKAGTIPTCRLVELFSTDPQLQKCPPLKDKYVILTPVGNALAGSSDFRTPLGQLSRAEILANILLTAKYQLAPLTVSTYFLLLAIFSHVLLLGHAILKRTAAYHSLLAFNFLFTETLVAVLGLNYLKLQIPLVPFVIATLTSYIFFVWLKSVDQEHKRWRALERAQSHRELEEYKSNFISLMSHDLKTPIAKVQALTERLSREALSLAPEQKLILAAIQKSNEELTKYIVSILNFQKIETNELRLNRKSHDINALIEEVLQSLEPLASDKKIALEKELEPMFLIEFDEQLIREVLNNLVENAIKYNPAGTLVLVHSEDQGEFIKVSVKDNGTGLLPEDEARLFKKFSRQEKTTSERAKGTGLGLYLCKYFLELHDGRIEYESTPGKGTEFRFFLPVSASD